MLDRRFAYEKFVAATVGERRRLADELALELTRRVQASSIPAQASLECIDDLNDLGHDLWSFDESDDFQLWCGDWTAPRKALELVVEVYYRDKKPRSVSISFKKEKNLRR